MEVKKERKSRSDKGIPRHRESVKKRHGVLLTDVVWLKMQTIAKENGMSVGQLVEKTFREMEAPEQ